MALMGNATRTDYLKQNADNIWFVLGAYFFAFFPWMVMHNIDFISEKWRTCRRTRRLAHIHLASSVFPIIYVAVYAEAQRRDEDNKELGAALAALMFNIFQLMRTIMGLAQLNAFVAWCKHAVECMNALQGDYYPRPGRRNAAGRGKTGKVIAAVQEWMNMFLSWCKCVSWRMTALQECNNENLEDEEQCRSEEEIMDSSPEQHEPTEHGAEEHMDVLPEVNEKNKNTMAGNHSCSIATVNHEVESANANSEDGNELNSHNSELRNRQETMMATEIPEQSTITSSCLRVPERLCRVQADDRDGIEDVVMVNNMVVDNELGGREVTVLPSWEKIWSEVRKVRFTPCKWLRTDRVILNTVRWGGAYLCGMGADWTAHMKDFPFDFRDGTEILDSFFSRDMEDVRSILQHVEWDISAEGDEHELLSIHRCGDDDIVELTGEMSTAYGSCVTNYVVSDTSTVGVYSFEFSSLVSSYPASKKITTSANRERIVVGLVHSVLIAKHLGVPKLQAIRRYYDRQHIPRSSILRKAFEILLMQTSTNVSNDSEIWKMFNSFQNQIPIFPYRMQMVALWNQATNWRVLQASAYLDVQLSIDNGRCLRANPTFLSIKNGNTEQVVNNESLPINIFEYSSKWTLDHIHRGCGVSKGSLGVVLETVRSFLAEWISANQQEPNWHPEISTASVEFNIKETTEDKEGWYLIWICQRELQRKVAKTTSEEQNLPGNEALIMLLILGFPLLHIDCAPNSEFGSRNSQDRVQEVSASSSSSMHSSIDMRVDTWRVWAPLSPQDISLIVRCDSGNGDVSLKLRNNSRDRRFIWQDWVDAGMGCMHGFEECEKSGKGYGRKIVRADLRKPIIELCPLFQNEPGIRELARTGTARIWMGWPAFDVRISKFEVEQWFHACNADIQEYWASNRILESFEEVISAVISAENG